MSVKASRWAVLRTLSQVVRGTRAAGAPGFGELFAAMPRLIWATVTGRYTGMGRARLGTLALAAVYLLSPIDVVPELFLPLIGLGDDLVVLSFVLSGLLAESEQFLAWERSSAVRQGGSAAPGHNPVVEGEVVDLTGGAPTADGRRR